MLTISNRRFDLSSQETGQCFVFRTRAAPLCSIANRAWSSFSPRVEELESRRLLAATGEVVARHIFYNESSFDGQTPGPSPSDDTAIAPDKSAYIPGSGVVTPASATSYSRGINGIMVDISGSHPSISADDFVFRVGTDPNTLDNWSAAPAPSGVQARAAAGEGGADRVTVTWNAGAILNEWLEVIVVANDDTGLAVSDRFFFGNRVGDNFAGSPPTLFVTNAGDEIAARLNPAFNVGLTNALDFDRNQFVNAADQIIARTNGGYLSRISVASELPSVAAQLSNDTAPGGTTNNDGVTSDPTVVATIDAPKGLASLTAELNGLGPVDVSSYLSGNTLTVDSALYQVLNGGPLLDGDYQLRINLVDAHGQNAISMLNFTLSTTAPVVTAASAVTVSNDVTPHLTVTGSDDGVPLDNVTVDVDLNYDGDFSDPGELNYGTASLWDGLGYFQLQPALPANIGGAAYYVQIRARASDSAGNEGTSTPLSLKIDTLGNTVLEDYVNTPDPSYGYSLARTINGSTYTAYVLDLTSQTWRSTADVNKPVWQHWLQIIVPNGASLSSNTALLLIDGGSTQATAPTSVSSQLVSIAEQTGSIVIDLPTVPNQPLIFTGDPGNSRTEDEILSYTFRQYMDHLGEPGNETWPALLPMVKSAVAAMDATQSFVPTVVPSGHVDDFVVTGYSKRGWTTWLTAAVDDRVRAIIPGVIDVLNIDEQMKHHYEFYGGFSSAINDYVGFNIVQDSFTPEGQELGRVIDPYFYLNNGRFDDMPKLLLNASGDEFFVPDSGQFYFSDIPGTQNYVRYVPNSGHGISSTIAGQSTVAFFNSVVQNAPLPEFSWTVRSDGQIAVDATTTPSSVVVWRATNPTARDFRKAYTSVTWTSTTVPQSPDGMYRAESTLAGAGAQAFFIQLTFPGSYPGADQTFTTQVSVVDTFSTTPWPYYMPVNPPPGGALVANELSVVASADTIDSVAFALTLARNDLYVADPVVAPVVVLRANALAVEQATGRATALYETEPMLVLSGEEVEDELVSVLLGDVESLELEL